jgi:type IV pilus modification protein PilV
MSSARKRERHGATRGFGLIEVLVAVLLFSIGGLAVAQLQWSATRANQAAVTRQIATNLARQLLESVEAASYGAAGLAATGGGGFVSPPAAFSPANPLNASGEASGTARIFTREWRIEATGGTSPSTENFKTIRVRVSWNQAGRPEQIEMRTIKGWDL